jgi:hypothetical protein
MGQDPQAVMKGCAVLAGKGEMQVAALRLGFHQFPVCSVPERSGEEVLIEGRKMPGGGKLHRGREEARVRNTLSRPQMASREWGARSFCPEVSSFDILHLFADLFEFRLGVYDQLGKGGIVGF